MSTPPDWNDLDRHLAAIHRTALTAADPAAAVRRGLAVSRERLSVDGVDLPLAPKGRVILVALGKASPAMAGAALAVLGERFHAGVVAHPHGTAVGDGWPERLLAVAAGHPTPDAGSLAAGEAAERLLTGLGRDDLVLVLVSGGGSALMELPIPGVTLERLAELTRALQRAGADIQELNTVRRALSRLEGGGLLRLAAPARVAALLLSDVMGDSPAAIASGPVVASPTGPAEAREVLERRGLAAEFGDVADSLGRTAMDAPPPAARVGVVGSNRLAAESARDAASALGFRSVIATSYLQGEAREAGRVIGGVARTVIESGVPLRPPACLIFGGETTVTVRGGGHGGRNQELALGAALALEGVPRAAVFSFATDGVDGSSDAAGAWVTGETLAQARALGLSPHGALADNDTAPFFVALGSSWRTGPSGTNVNDLTVVLAYS